MSAVCGQDLREGIILPSKGALKDEGLHCGVPRHGVQRDRTQIPQSTLKKQLKASIEFLNTEFHETGIRLCSGCEKNDETKAEFLLVLGELGGTVTTSRPTLASKQIPEPITQRVISEPSNPEPRLVCSALLAKQEVSSIDHCVSLHRNSPWVHLSCSTSRLTCRVA